MPKKQRPVIATTQPKRVDREIISHAPENYKGVYQVNNLQIFNYNENEMRTIEKDGEIWWVLKDVCDVLEIAKTDSAARRLDDDEKGTHLVSTPSGFQNMTIINEPGLYNVILRSDKPNAKDFKRWVTHEVIPQIRKKGQYSVPEYQPMTPIQLIAAQAQAMVDIEKRLDAMDAKTTELAEKVDKAVEVFEKPTADHWRDDTDKAIRELVETYGLSPIATRGRMFTELERKSNSNLQTRLTHLRNRSRKAGMTYRDSMALGKLDAIAADKKLRLIFDGIVREWQARYLSTYTGGYALSVLPTTATPYDRVAFPDTYAVGIDNCADNQERLFF